MATPTSSLGTGSPQCVPPERLSLRISFQLEDEALDTSEPLFGSVHTQNIIVFILVLYANGVEGSLGHF